MDGYQRFTLACTRIKSEYATTRHPKLRYFKYETSIKQKSIIILFQEISEYIFLHKRIFSSFLG